MVDELNTPGHRWYQPRYHVPLAKNDVSKKYIYASGIRKIDDKIIRQALFASSEPGAWYDPSDLTTMFQDSAGTIPVTAVGQPVGLRLDKSKGLVLGPELVTNGDFSGGTTGWSGTSATLSEVSGRLRVTNSSASPGRGRQTIATVIGRTYAYRVDAFLGSASSFRFRVLDSSLSAIPTSDSGSLTQNSVGTVRYFTATTTTSTIELLCNDSVLGNYVEFDNVSVKELPGFHAAQSTPGSRAIYASVPKGGRRNLYTNTGFSGGATGTPGTAPTGWTASFATGSITAITADASLGGNSITVSATAGRQCFHQLFNAGTSTTWTLSADVVLSQQTQLDQIAVFAGTLTGATMAFYLNGALVANTTQVPAGTHRVAVVLTVTTTALTGVQARVGIGTASNATGTVKVSNPQLEAGSVATAYQIVRTIYDIQEAGVQTLYGLLYDGLDDFYVTPTITPGTDKVQVFAGVRKLSDAAGFPMIVEFSTDALNLDGAFALTATGSAGTATYQSYSRGTISTNATTGSVYPAPRTSVLAAMLDIGGDRNTLRVDGVQAAQSTANQGTGNYLAYPLYIGRRNGTTLPFNGYEFGQIIRFGANLSAAQIASTEAWLNTRTGAY